MQDQWYTRYSKTILQDHTRSMTSKILQDALNKTWQDQSN